MDFKNWFLLQEMGNVLALDTSHITFRPVGADQNTESSWLYEFKYDKKPYYVQLSPATANYQGIIIDKIYNIAFNGPHGFELTNQSGSSATAIYTQVILAIKKFIETHQINGLQFSAYESKMKLVYRRFFDQYLKKDFIQIDNINYVRKNTIKELLATRPNIKQQAYASILNARRTSNEKIKEIRQDKDYKRKVFLELKKLMHQVLFGKNGLIFIPYELNNDEVKIITFNKQYGSSLEVWPLNEVNLKSWQPTNSEIKIFLQNIVDDKGLIDFIESETGLFLKKLFTQYHIAIPEKEIIWGDYIPPPD